MWEGNGHLSATTLSVCRLASAARIGCSGGVSEFGKDWKESWRQFATRWGVGKKRLWWSFLIYVVVTWLIFGWFDEPLLAWVQGMELGLGREKWVAFCKWLKVYSDLLWFNFFGAIALYLYGFFKKKKSWRVAGVSFFLAALMAGAAVQTAKAVFGRPRPSTLVKSEEANSAYDFRGPIIKGGWDSYPSGHSAAVWASCLALGFRRRKAMIPLILFACLVAWSRMYGNYHWPTDVISGSALGAIFGWFWGMPDRKEEEPSGSVVAEA